MDSRGSFVAFVVSAALTATTSQEAFVIADSVRLEQLRSKGSIGVSSGTLRVRPNPSATEAASLN